MMNEKRASKQVTLEDWSQPTQSASDQHSLEISRTFKLSVATPHISIEALGGHYHGIIKHTIEKLNPDSPPPSPTNSFSSWSTTSSHEGCHSPNNRPKINVQVTITYREGDLNSAKEISVVHQKRDNKVCDRIVVSRKSTLSNTFSWKKPPFVEILVIYPFNTCLGNESVSTKSVNLPVVVEDLSKIFFTQFIVESTNGYVDVQSATANSLLMISSTNGPITSSGVLRAPKVKLTTVNAPIQVSNLISPENVSLQSTNGPINVTSSLRSNVLTIENINGSISLNSVVASSTMKVSSHNQIEIKSAKSNSMLLNTYQGKIEGSFNVNKEIKLTTKAGSIDAKIQISKPFNGNQVQSEINSGTGRIQVRYQPHPEEIKLISTIKSEIGSIDLIHSQGYAGKFKVESKLGRVEIENEEKIEDKSIEQSKAGGRKVEGEIKVGESKTLGRSEVSTNLGSIKASFSN